MKKALSIKTAIILIAVASIVLAIAIYELLYKPGETPRELIKAAVIIRKRGDLGFNDMAWLGGERARTNLGVHVEYFYYENVPMEKYTDFLEEIVAKGFDIIVVVNFMMAENVAELADKYPAQKFAILDAVIEGKPNVMSIVFRENEGSALVGALAALLTKTDKVGIVLGMDIEPLWKFEIGFKWGVQYINNLTGRNVKVLWNYVGSFGNPPAGKEAARLMLQQGADIVYHAAGETGLGVIEAIYEYSAETGLKVYAIGVDSPQEWVKPGYVIVSMVKHVDVAVYKAIESVVKGEFKNGVISLGIKEKGVDISMPEDVLSMINIAVELKLMKSEEADEVYNTIMSLRNSVPDDIWSKIFELKNEIINNKVSIPIPTPINIGELRKIYG